MEKRLARVGNSYALVIDRALRQTLGIDENTTLRLTTDGARLIVEPWEQAEPRKKRLSDPWDRPEFVRTSSSKTSEDRRGEYYAAAVVRELIKHGLTHEHTRELHHASWTTDLYWAFLMNRPIYATPGDRLTFRRFELCLEAVRRGVDWEEAISSASREVPITQRISARWPLRDPHDAVEVETGTRSATSEWVRDYLRPDPRDSAAEDDEDERDAPSDDSMDNVSGGDEPSQDSTDRTPSSERTSIGSAADLYGGEDETLGQVTG